MAGIKDFLLKQIVVRILYTAGSFATSHLIALAAMGPVQSVLSQAGVSFQVTDPSKLETYLTGLLMIGAEFVLHAFHQNVVLPQVAPTQGETK